MAEIILSFVVEEALSNVLSCITEEIKSVWGLDDELNRLRDSSATVRDLLQDAEGKQMENMAVMRWLKKIKLWAYDAEDLLDELEYEAVRRKVEVQNREEVNTRSLLKFTKPIPFVHKTTFRIKMAHKVKKASEALVQIKNEAFAFGLIRIPVDRKMPEISSYEETDSIVDHPVVARDVEVSKIVDLLEGSRNQQPLTAHAIVGMGGIGKTTVAKLVCQEAMEKKLFDVKVWVSVSTDFNEKQILGEMLQTLCKNAGGITNMDATLQHLSEELNGKTFLLVLDNVWNVEEGSWNRLKHRLSSVTKKNGNAIVVTTRSEEVASLMESSPQFWDKLNLMSDDECWSIIENSNKLIAADLKAIGKEIARKCRGLPLVARVIGGTLRRHTSIEEWLAIKNSNVLNISASVNSILRLSFDRLPFHLKPCFSYCSIYPKGADIQKIDLITQWRGHGFLGSSNIDAGENYFNELLRGSFFTDAKQDEYGRIESVRMHDLMLELALSVSMLDTLNSENYSAGNDTSHVQHLDIYQCGGAAEAVPMFLKDKTLRTLIAASADVFYDSWKFKGLRILRLRGENVKALPDSVGMLKHLRFLDVSYSEITELPESITKLYNLQDLWMYECKLLETVPKRLKNLVNLRSVRFTYEKQMPSGVSYLTNLRSLSYFVIGRDQGSSIQELEHLNELSFQLIITNLELVRDEEEAKKANLQSKAKLEELQLVWSGERDFEEQDSEDSNYNVKKVLEGMQPCKNLKGLQIKNYWGDTFPSWLLTMKVIGFGGDCCTLNNLTRLRLEGCRRCGEIPRVGHLPLLKKLEIIGLDDVRCIGDEFYGSNEASKSGEGKLFPSLKTFSIRSMKSLVEWKAPPTFNAFPCLEELTVTMCPKLKSIPTSHLSSLVEFSMKSCDALGELLFDEAHPLASLRVLEIRGNFGNLVSFPSVEGLTSLVELWIAGCHKLTSLPRGLRSCLSLSKLAIINCHGLASLPDDLGELRSLVSFYIVDCPNVTNFTGDIFQTLTQLQNLVLSCYYEALNSIQHIPSLDTVALYGRNDFESLPHQLQSLSLIKYLFVAQFHSMEALPKWLEKLSSIEYISIKDCSNLKYLPSAIALQALSHLKELKIVECPHLKESCAKGTGSEWSKISHIPKVSIDGDILQNLGT